MAVIKTLSNSECIMWCEFDQEVSTEVAEFATNIHSSDTEDTLEIQCGEDGCLLRLEKYIKIVQDSRQMRTGIFPAACLVTELNRSSRQNDV